MLTQIKTYITEHNALKEISPRGNCKDIKTNKPKNGIYAYIWRMARFYSGQDTCMPMTASWDLHSGIETVFGVKYWTSQKDERGITVKAYQSKEIEDYLDLLAEKLVDQLGLGPMKLKVNADQTLELTGNKNSLNAIAISGIVSKVNRLDADTLLTVYYCAKTVPFPVGRAKEIYDKALPLVLSGEAFKDKVKPTLTLSEIRQALVKQNGGSINGPVDTYLDVAIMAQPLTPFFTNI